MSNLRTSFPQLGFGFIELIVAVGIFLILATGGVTAILQGQTANRLTEQQQVATAYAGQGLEAVRSIKNQDYASLSAGSYGLSSSGDVWSFSGASDSQGIYTRQIVISEGRRSGGSIVDSGGTIDPDFFKIVSTVTWNFSPTRSESISQVTYLSDFRQSLIGDWSSVTPIGAVDLPGNDNGIKVATVGNYAYVIRQSGSNNFVVLDVSNPASPTTATNISLTGSLTNIFLSGNRAYVTSTNNNGELYVVDITNPAAVSLLGTYNAPGNENGNDISVVGTTGYFVRSSGGNQEFTVLDLSNPAAISILGGVNLAGNANQIVVSGSYGYIASSDNGSELQVVNFSTPAAPSLVGSYNASGSSDALSVALAGTTALLGINNGDLYTLSVSTPASPSLLDTLNVTNDINDIAVESSYTYAFLATDVASGEFIVISIANPADLSTATSANLNGTAEGVAYNSDLDRVFVVSSANNEEFIGMQPN